MNDPHDSIADPNDDSALEEMLSPLKQLEPPLDARLRNRTAVANELQQLLAANRQRNLPWWHRRVSIPVPIAACLAVLAALVLLSSYRGGPERPSGHFAAPDRPAERAPHLSEETSAVAKQLPNARPAGEYFETETYLCGIGRLKSESGYIFRSKTDD